MALCIRLGGVRAYAAWLTKGDIGTANAALGKAVARPEGQKWSLDF
jgi:hypothetical protein